MKPVDTARAVIAAAELAERMGRSGTFYTPELKPLATSYLEMVEALKEVVAISDRKHDAWDRVHAALRSGEREG